MGSSGESNLNVIDASVGGLVWVRRRNGSWWPGRIMGLHELSESCLVSPRSGTPVKLLGREDASVLDKPGSEHGGSAGELPLMSNSGEDNEDVVDDLSDSDDNSNAAPELSQSGISFEEPNHYGTLKMQSVQGRRRRTPNDSEDDGFEGVKRMRGLEDLGIGVVSKRQVQGTSATEIVHHISASLNNSTAGNCLANGTSVNGGKGYSSTLKRKRSQVANAHELLKRKNRRRPLTKVLESTAMVSVPVICNQLPSSSSSPLCGVTDGRISGLDSNGSKKTFPTTTHNSDSTEAACENGTSLIVHDHGSDDASQINHEVKENETFGIPGLVGKDSPDELFDVPFVGVLGEEKHTTDFSPIQVSCSSGKPQVSALGEQSCNASQCEAVSLRNESKNEPGCTSSAAGHIIVGHRADKGSSKWQSKGKRNSRHTSKNIKHASRKYVDTDPQSSAYLSGIGISDGIYQGACQKVDWNGMGAPNTSYKCTSQVKCKPVAVGQLEGFRDLNKHIKGTTTEAKLLPDGSLTPQRLLPYRHSRFTVNSRYQTADFPGRNYYSDASLYDVKLEVKSSYRPQHVPLVSLVSKLNGKAFIGHPLAVEVLVEGHCDKMLSDIGCDLEVGDVYCAAKPNSVTRRIHSKNLTRFSPSKSSKMKKTGLLNKKIRKLSSLTGHKQLEEERKPVVDKLKGPVIACIPLKVVFSRINEAVSGQARSTYRALPTSSNP
ncbi:hypothetical protein JHK85_017675 [Glycine max]|nr:hypothetical protein JHK85_017675 [Glycine max]